MKVYVHAPNTSYRFSAFWLLVLAPFLVPWWIVRLVAAYWRFMRGA